MTQAIEKIRGFTDWVWTTRDRREIPVSQMDDAHLVNLCWFLHRRTHPTINHKPVWVWMVYALLECRRRGITLRDEPVILFALEE